MGQPSNPLLFKLRLIAYEVWQVLWRAAVLAGLLALFVVLLCCFESVVAKGLDTVATLLNNR